MIFYLVLLLPVALLPINQKKAAYIARSLLIAKPNTSQIITCESDGEALDWCLWGRTVKGQRQLITIEKEAITQVDDGQIEGISTFGSELQKGSCSLRVESITEEDSGTWSCTLFAQTGTVSTGQVEVSVGSQFSHILSVEICSDVLVD